MTHIPQGTCEGARQHRVVIIAPYLAWAREIERAYREKNYSQQPVQIYIINRPEQLVGLSECDVLIHYQWSMNRTFDEFMQIQHRLDMMRTERRANMEYIGEDYYR